MKAWRTIDSDPHSTLRDGLRPQASPDWIRGLRIDKRLSFIVELPFPFLHAESNCIARFALRNTLGFNFPPELRLWVLVFSFFNI